MFKNASHEYENAILAHTMSNRVPSTFVSVSAQHKQTTSGVNTRVP